MIFARETCAQVGSEIIPLTLKHHEEISKYKEIPLKPDFAIYYKMEELGWLRIYTARLAENNQLVGYQFYFLAQHPHYAVMTAKQDLLFIDPEHRGRGLAFMDYCEDQLRYDDIAIVYASVTTRFDYSSILKRRGYELTESLYSKRLKERAC